MAAPATQISMALGVARFSDPDIWSKVIDQTLIFCIILGENRSPGHELQTHGCCRALDPDIALCSSPGLGDTMILGDRVGHSDQDVSSGSMTLIHHHNHRLRPFCNTVDSTGHPNLAGFDISTALGHQYLNRLWPRPWASM